MVFFFFAFRVHYNISFLAVYSFLMYLLLDVEIVDAEFIMYSQSDENIDSHICWHVFTDFS